MIIKFISNNHFRINNRIKSNSDNLGVFRGILIKALGESLFEVSIEILEAPFYHFQNNFQMTPKIMKIISDESGLVYLKGINEFSDYVIKMNCLEEYIKDITLVMIDRDSEITYLNAEQRYLSPVSTDNEAIKKILEILIVNYDEEERTSSLSVENIIHEFNQLITPQKVDQLINILNKDRKVLSAYKAIKIPENKEYFSILSAEYEDAYFTDESLSFLKVLINKY